MPVLPDADVRRPEVSRLGPTQTGMRSVEATPAGTDLDLERRRQPGLRVDRALEDPELEAPGSGCLEGDLEFGESR